MEVLVVLDIDGVTKKDIFEKHLKREGFESVPDENYVYLGSSTTTIPMTKAYIVHVFKEALEKTDFNKCKLIYQIDELPMEAYKFNKQTNEFEKEELKN